MEPHPKMTQKSPKNIHINWFAHFFFMDINHIRKQHELLEYRSCWSIEKWSCETTFSVLFNFLPPNFLARARSLSAIFMWPDDITNFFKHKKYVTHENQYGIGGFNLLLRLKAAYPQHYPAIFQYKQVE